MALNENGSDIVMPVSPMYGAGGGSNGMGWGDGSYWFILLFLFAFMGNGNWGGNGGVVQTQNDVQRGFDQQAIMSGINGINAALAGAEISRANSESNIMQTLNNMAMQFQNCCCENRAATADLKYTIASEACATRQADAANTQAILDKLCQQEIDALKTQNDQLRTQLNLASLAASQTDQTAKILADNAAQTIALEQYLNPVPIPAYMVQNPNCCGNSYYNGCGCSA